MAIKSGISVIVLLLLGAAQAQELQCDEVYIATAEPGRIASPAYPNEYPNNHDSCNTTIYAVEGQLIKLNFEEFDLESHTSCSYDHLEIRDGDNSTSPLLGRFCGNSTPANITSSGNSMWIEFHSDGSVTRAGFLAYFTAFNETPNCWTESKKKLLIGTKVGSLHDLDDAKAMCELLSGCSGISCHKNMNKGCKLYTGSTRYKNKRVYTSYVFGPCTDQ